MTGLPRFAPKSLKLIALAAALAAPMVFVAPLAAQPAPAGDAAAPAAAVAPSPEVKNAVENFWHYGKIARYDLATAEAEKILAANADPQSVLVALEQVSSERQDSLDEWLLRWQGVDQMRDVATKVNAVVADGYRARRSSPEFIKEQISRLFVNDRAYSLAMPRLRESGELTVPFMVDLLRDPTKKSSAPTIRRALRDLGRLGLHPLVAATEMQDWDTLNVLIATLGDMGYDMAAPYISRVIESAEAPAATKAVAAEALAKLGAVQTKASDGFFAIGQKFYDNQSSITADTRFPQANIWRWDSTANTLVRTQVPHAIFNDIMAMRSSEHTLKLGGAHSDDALSLWLAANYKREADLPEGQTDATRPESYPPGHYWGVEAGSRYLNAALARALKDRNSAVAYRVIRSLQEIVGQSNLFVDQSSRPLINAMQYQDRKVRFEAAFALAGALPQTKFEGQQRVIPLLAEAIAQTGQTSVLVVLPAQDGVNTLVDSLKKENFAVAGATSAEAGVNVAAALPGVDVIIVSDDIGPGKVDDLFNLASQNPKLAGAARLVIAKSNASPYEARKVSEPLLSTTTATEAPGLKPAIEEARTKAGALPLDPALATEYATRAGQLLMKVGISRGQIYDLEPAKPALLAGLNDARPEIVKLAGQALAYLNDKDSQSGLLVTASDSKTTDEVKISLYKSLATSAKFFGNKLSAAEITTLEATVADATNLDVRSAAAEARGALNLPADQAKNLIVKQAKL